MTLNTGQSPATSMSPGRLKDFYRARKKSRVYLRSMAIKTKKGRTGMQGQYNLTGKGEVDFIQPVSGTVKVRINGRELDEGNEKDFVVDYGLGTITFTPKNLIKDEDLIRIEY